VLELKTLLPVAPLVILKADSPTIEFSGERSSCAIVAVEAHDAIAFSAAARAANS
jgi:hypothetical protein